MTLPRGKPSHVVVSSLVAFAVTVGCSASSTNGAATPRHVSMVHAGDDTYVAITDEAPEPENPDCTKYCDRVVACWYALPGSDPAANEQDIRAHCRSEQGSCHGLTQDTYCCARRDDCQDFAQCQASSRGVSASCRTVAAR